MQRMYSMKADTVLWCPVDKRSTAVIKSGKHRSARQKDETLAKPSWPMRQRSSGGPGGKDNATASHQRGKAEMGAAWKKQHPRDNVGSPIEEI